jgi:hypothetical protein
VKERSSKFAISSHLGACLEVLGSIGLQVCLINIKNVYRKKPLA